mgnify:FL=1
MPPHQSADDRPSLVPLDGCTVDLTTGMVHRRDGESTLLTPMQLHLVEVLAASRGQMVDRETLFLRLWDEPWDGRSRRLDMLVRRTRLRLGDSTRPPRIIQTRYGSGFRIVTRSTSVAAQAHQQALDALPAHTRADLLRAAHCPGGIPRRWLSNDCGPLIAATGATESNGRVHLPAEWRRTTVAHIDTADVIDWFDQRVCTDARALQIDALGPRSATALARGVALVAWLTEHPALLRSENVAHVVDCLSPLYRYCLGPDRITELTNALEQAHPGVDLTGPITYLRNRGSRDQMGVVAEDCGALWGPALTARALGRTAEAQAALGRHAEEARARGLLWLAHHAEFGRVMMQRGRTEMAACLDAHALTSARRGVRGPLWEADLALAEAFFVYTDSGAAEAIELLHHAAAELRATGAVVRALHALALACEHRVSTDDLTCLDQLDTCLAEARALGAQRIEGWFLDYRMTTLFGLGRTDDARRCALSFHARVARWDPADARLWSTRVLRAIDLMGAPTDPHTRARAAKVSPVFAAVVDILETGGVGAAALRAADEAGGVVPETLRALDSDAAEQWLAAPDPADIQSRLDPIDRRLLGWARRHAGTVAPTVPEVAVKIP